MEWLNQILCLQRIIPQSRMKIAKPHMATSAIVALLGLYCIFMEIFPPM